MNKLKSYLCALKHHLAGAFSYFFVKLSLRVINLYLRVYMFLFPKRFNRAMEEIIKEMLKNDRDVGTT